MINPLVTVYVPSHNYGRFLEVAIESVLRQSISDWELILVNDGSSDNSTEVMALYESDSRVRVYNTNGIGLHQVCNLALREAHGKYIIRLDGDDVFDENILLVLSNALENNPDAAMVFPDYYLIDVAGQIIGIEQRQRIYTNNHTNDVPPHGACMMARTDVLRAVGGYSDVLKAQDGYYIWSKIVPHQKCINVNLPLFYYRRHDLNLTNVPQQVFLARQAIKREKAIDSLNNFRPIIAVIPCRKSYDFQADVWSLPLYGRSLLEISISTCIASEVFDHIVIACDNPDSEKTILKFTDRRLAFYLRSTKDTLRSLSIVTTLEKISQCFDPNRTGLSVLCYVQSPLVTTTTLEEAVYTLIINDADSAVAVEEITKPVYKRTQFGLQLLNPTLGISNDFQKIYAESRIVIASRNQNFPSGSLSGPKTVYFESLHQESHFIDSPKMYQIAQIMHAYQEDETKRAPEKIAI